MAQYKVPQDVEAEDKLLGPFTFRQFVYLLIAAAGIAGAWGLAQIFLPLCLIPIPAVIFFGVLALPLKKDQPMEVYLAALVSFYVKPRLRFWRPGQSESTILITAPKKVEKSRTRNISEDEASHRLSFLAEIVDTEGYAIRNDSSMQDEYAAEADSIEDILEQDSPVIDQMIEKEQEEHKQQLIQQMRTAVNRTDALTGNNNQQTRPVQTPGARYQQPVQTPQPAQNYQLPQNYQPIYQPTQTYQPVQSQQQFNQQSQPTRAQVIQQQAAQAEVNQQMQNLANNNTFSIQTIAQQANRIQAFAPQPMQPAQQQFVSNYHPVQPVANPQPVQPAAPPIDPYAPQQAIFSPKE